MFVVPTELNFLEVTRGCEWTERATPEATLSVSLMPDTLLELDMRLVRKIPSRVGAIGERIDGAMMVRVYIGRSVAVGIGVVKDMESGGSWGGSSIRGEEMLGIGEFNLGEVNLGGIGLEGMGFGGASAVSSG
jgi:hypothetical protein